MMAQVVFNMPKNKDAQNDNGAKAQNGAKKQSTEQMPDPMALSQALMNAYQKSQPQFIKMVEQYQKDLSSPQAQEMPSPDPFNVMPDAFKMMAEMGANPMGFMSKQMDYAQKQMNLWNASMQRLAGKDVAPIAEPKKGDKRFADEAWSDSTLFDFLKQYYLLACNFVEDTIEETNGLTKEQKNKLSFSTKLIMDALSPSNFLMTNPVVLRETIATGGQNLVKGLQNFNEDLTRGKGVLDISMTDTTAFTLGKDLATTEGSVVFETDLMQLIQYKPTTDKVAKRPILISPPWINKFYILDLKPENSYIKWAVDQGHTVFCISWVNPDAKLSQKTFEDYMREGILAALDKIQDITGEPDVNAIGYCLGGTLLTTTMAYLAAKGQENRIASATFLTTMVDFEKSGDMKLFMGEAMLNDMEETMKAKGVFPASKMKQTFSLLRANDLIWSFVVNNYLMGKENFPFDLLYWNDDATNMPSAMHIFYLKNMYQQNRLKDVDGIEIDGVKIDVRIIETPCYFLSAKEDHIAPWEATYATTQLLGGPKTFTLAGSGHIAGVVNPPAKNKYNFWSSDDAPGLAEDWLEGAVETEGSWWNHWNDWVKEFGNGETPAREIKSEIEPAPGRYVMVKSD